MPEQTLKQKTAKGLFWGGLSNGVQQILNLVFGLVLARILSAEDYGMVGMLAIFSAIAGTIQESGFTAALTNQKEIRKEDYNAVFWFSALTGITFYIMLFFCAPLIARFYERPELVGLSRIVFLGFLFGGLGIASNAYLFKTLRTKERAKIDILALFCSGIIGISLALNGFAYYGLAIQTVSYILVGSLLKLYYSAWKPDLCISFKPLKKMFGFGFKLVLTNFFIQINNNVLSVILGKFYDAKQLGFYTQGQKWMGMGNQLMGGMLNAVSQPVLVQVIDDSERQSRVFRKMVRFGAFISFPMMLGLAFVAKEFILILLGAKWLPSVYFLQVFCIWGAFWYLQSLYTNLLISHEKSNYYLYGMVITGGLQLLALFASLPFGVYVMAASVVSVNILGLMVWHGLSLKFLHVPIWDMVRDIFPYCITTIGSICVVFVLLYKFENIYLLLISKIILVMFFYLVIMKFSGSVILKDICVLVKKRLESRKTY